MTATTKIYRVMAQDHMMRHWHFSMKRDAKLFARNWKKENDPENEYDAPEIDVLIVPLNARGIAEALDDLIDMTCANEG